MVGESLGAGGDSLIGVGEPGEASVRGESFGRKCGARVGSGTMARGGPTWWSRSKSSLNSWSERGDGVRGVSAGGDRGVCPRGLDKGSRW